MKSFGRITLLLIVAMAFVPSTQATWGDYDPTFGFFGMAIDNVVNHYPAAVAIQPDGKILVTGTKIVSGRKRFFLRRYLSNGQLDTSFGTNGAANPTAPLVLTADYFGSRVIVQSDGKIVVSGVGNLYQAIWRFTSSGAVDSSIGPGGMKLFTAYGTNQYFFPRVATYGNLLYVGLVKPGNTSTVVIKMNSDGTQDLSFGIAGEATTDATTDYLLDIDPTSGNILVSGETRSIMTDSGVQRILTTGVSDPAFSHWSVTGAVYPPYMHYRFIRRANGTFVGVERWFNVASGGGGTLGANYIRLTSTGGFVSRNIYEPSEYLPGGLEGGCPDILAEQQDGKMVWKGMNNDELYRYSANFLTIQKMSCSFSYPLVDYSTAAVLQSDNKMVAAAKYGANIAVIRTLP